MKAKWLKILVLAFLTLGLVSCETEEDNKMEKARACLDKNPSGDASNQCLTYLNGLSGPQVDSLRAKIKIAAKNYIGLMARAYSGGLDSALGALIDTTNGLAGAQELLSIAQASGNSGLIAVATASYVATLCCGYGTGGCSCGAACDTAIKTGCTNVANATGGASATQQADLANQAVTLKNAACSDPSAQASTDPNNLCKKMTDALNGAGGPAAAIAAYLTAQ